MSPVEPSSSQNLGGAMSDPNGTLFQQAFYSSPAMQSVVRAEDGIIIEVNDSFLEKLGFRRAEVIGKTAAQLAFWIHPEELAAYRDAFASSGEVQPREVHLRDRYGKTLTVLLSSHPVKINGTLHVPSAGVDISERKQAEAELRAAHEHLRQSEERFSKAFRLSPAMMAVTRLSDGKFVSANEAFPRAIGYSEAEAIGRTGNELQIHASQERRETFLQGVESKGIMRDYEFVIRSKDGRLRTLLALGERTIIHGEPHLLSVAQDITERKEAETRLRQSEQSYRESEQRLRTMIRASPAAVTLARLPEGTFVTVNEAFVRLSGFAENEVLGRTSSELNLYVHSSTREVSSNVSARRASCAISNISCGPKAARSALCCSPQTGWNWTANRTCSSSDRTSPPASKRRRVCGIAKHACARAMRDSAQRSAPVPP
ncbi:MAG: PAS domain S-box protein [Verrucomicrobiota bacterium]